VEIKAAYHRVLLSSHPDKRSLQCNSRHNGSDIDIAQLKNAYQTLCSPSLRAAHDAALLYVAGKGPSGSGPRPAQVISLEEFDGDDEAGRWWHVCRCGGSYVISEEDMESGHHLVGCDGCSEVIWVGFEIAEAN